MQIPKFEGLECPCLTVMLNEQMKAIENLTEEQTKTLQHQKIYTVLYAGVKHLMDDIKSTLKIMTMQRMPQVWDSLPNLKVFSS